MNEIKIKGFTIHDENGVTTVRQKVGLFLRIFLLAFISVWMTGWTVGCVALTVGLVNQFAFFSLLFAIPFYVGWLAGATALVASFSPGASVTLNRTELEFRNIPLLKSMNRRIAFKEISQVLVEFEDNSYDLIVKSSGNDATLFQSHRKESLESIREILQQKIPTLHTLPDADESRVDESKVDRPKIAKHRTTRPEETTWQFENKFGQTRLVNPGSFAPAAALVTMGICLFWNGIVGSFVVQTVAEVFAGNPEWGKALFLIPFILIGLVFLVVTLAIWCDPFRLIEYTFSHREIKWRHAYFGIGISKTLAMVGEVNVLITFDSSLDEPAQGDDYELMFFSKTFPRELKISPLTLAEAEWIATELEERQRFKVDRNIEDWQPD